MLTVGEWTRLRSSRRRGVRPQIAIGALGPIAFSLGSKRDWLGTPPHSREEHTSGCKLFRILKMPIQLPSATLLGVGHCVSETEDIGSRGTGWEARAGNPSLSQPCSGGACGPPGSLCACLHQFSSLLFGKNSCFYRLRTSRHSALTASLRLSANSRSHTQCAPAPVALHS